MDKLFLVVILALSGCAKPPPLSQVDDMPLKPINSAEWIDAKMKKSFDQEKARDARPNTVY